MGHAQMKSDKPLSSILIIAFYFLHIDRIIDYFASLLCRVRLRRLHHAGIPLNFIAQGGYRFEIAGPLQMFQIDPTSHIKSDTFIECSGGVTIGRYFHPGRGLTIFSTNHDYNSTESIPYGEESLIGPVCVGDFVWIGANVSIMPGVTIGEGAIVGGGSVVTKDVPKYAVVAGNPARTVKHRDSANFELLKDMKRYL
jgi:serine acetyltransferase